MPSSHKFLTPRYVEKFRCIGPACEDDCCHSWDITLDRVTYERYRSLPESPLRSIVDAHVLVRIQTPATAAQPDRFYGEVKLMPDTACPFLATDRLCRIQTELGAESLSAVCASFPRVSRSIDYHAETALQLSCPEAARLILLNPRLMHLPRTAPAGHARYAPLVRSFKELDPPDGNPFQYLWQFRYLCLLLLKDRTYPLWQRLFILGMITKRLTAISTGPVGNGETVPAALRTYAELMQQGQLRSAMDMVQPQPEKHLAIILQLLERRAALGPIPHRLLDCIRDFLAGIEYVAGQPTSSAVAGFMAARATCSPQSLRLIENVLENYLVNYMFLNRFPYGDDLAPMPGGTSPALEHALMCLRFALLRSLALGTAARYGKEFEQTHLVKLVQSFSKSFEHNLDVRNAIADIIAANRLTDTAGLALLLRM